MSASKESPAALDASVRERVNGLYDAVSSVDDVYRVYARSRKVVYSDFVVALLLTERGSRRWSQAALADWMGVTRTTMNTVVKRMEARGEVELVAMEGNRKEKLVCLTEKGRAAWEPVVAPALKGEAKAIGGVSDEELDAAVEVVTSFRDSLQKNLGLR